MGAHVGNDVQHAGVAGGQGGTASSRAGGLPAPTWTLLDGALIGEGPAAGNLVLAHPSLGLAIFQLDPLWSADAVERLEQKLAAAGFRERFPGRLPVIHRRLRREDVPELRSILDEAFSLQPPLTLPDDGAWVTAAHLILAPGHAPTEPEKATEAPGKPQEQPPAETATEPAAQAANDDVPAGPRRRRPALLFAAGGVAAALALVALLHGPMPGPGEALPPHQQVAANLHAVTRMDVGAAIGTAKPSGSPGEQAASTAEAVSAERAAPADPPVPASAVEPAAAVPAVAEPPAPSVEATAAVAEPPAAPAEERATPNIQVALAAPVAPAAPVEEPPAPNIQAALAATLTAEAPLPEEQPQVDLTEAIRSLGPPEPRQEVAAVAPTAVAPTAVAPVSAPVSAPAAPPARSAAAPAPAPAPPVAPLAVPDPPAVIGAMLLRGEALLAIGDVSGARRFFERAAASGSAQAAFRMAETYDAAALDRIGARGISPDRALSLAWYRHAQRLGETRATERIATLETAR